MTKKEKIQFEYEKSLYLLLLKKILDFFNGDYEKSFNWWITPNLLIGNLLPMEMVYSGRMSKLKIFIDSSLEDNCR